MQSKLKLFVISLFLLTWAQPAVNLLTAKSQNKITFVADYEEQNNWDIYIMNDDGTNKQRLTTHDSIDNHPTLYGDTLVWTSNRTGDFELYKAHIANVEGTIQRLTYRDIIRGKRIPDRHPKVSFCGSKIIFDAKTKLIINMDSVRDRCCQPWRIEIDTTPLYEALWIIDTDGTNLLEIDPELADVNNIWPSGGLYRDSIDVGHPALSSNRRHIVFSACLTGRSDDWEVYMMDLDGATPSNLRRITLGPTIGPNQIQMSAGASLSVDGSWIFFNSTRTPNGHSMIFKVDTCARDIIPLRDAIPLTGFRANAYIPTQYWPGWVIYVSDLEVTGDDTQPGLDMDVWRMREDGSSKENLTDDIFGDQTLELGDEVSWFCGLPRLLTPDTKIPKVLVIGSLQIIRRMDQDSNYLPNWPTPQLRPLYPIFWKTLDSHMWRTNPEYWDSILHWMEDTTQWDKEVVINTLMPRNFGPIDSVPPGKIRDLTATQDTIYIGDTIELNWTAPGDDDTIGSATKYHIRYSRKEPFSNPHVWWLKPEKALDAFVTGPAGSPQRYLGIVPESAGTYYFAIKTADEVGWWSGVSNYATVVVVPRPHRWIRKHDVARQPSGKRVRDGGGITALDDNVYLILGNNTLDFLKYSVAGDSWTARCSVPLGPIGRRMRRGSYIVDDENYAYVLKGGTNEFYKYDPSRDTWSTLSEPGFIRGARGGFATYVDYGGHFIYAGSGAANNEWKRYDILTNTWRTARPFTLPARAMIGSGLAYDGVSKIYFLGGGGRRNHFWYTDLSAATPIWIRLESLPLTVPGGRRRTIVREGGAIEYYNGKIYAVKGGNTKEFWCYEPTTDTWIYLDTIPATRGISCGRSLTSNPLGIFCLIGNNTNEFRFYGPAGIFGPSVKAGIAAQEIALTKKFSLKVTNPAKGIVRVYYTLPEKDFATLRIYNTLGKIVYSEKNDKGSFTVKNLPAGIYFLRFETNGYKEERKLVVVK